MPSLIGLRQTAQNLLKLEIEIKAFGIRFRPKGISHQTKSKQSHLQNLEDIIKEENATLKAEFIKLNKIKS